MTYSSAQDQNNAQRSTSIAAQARAAAAVVPSDTVDLAPYAKALYIGTTGNISVIPVASYAAGSSTPVVFNNVPVGWFPIQVARVMATGTTASNIVAVSS